MSGPGAAPPIRAVVFDLFDTLVDLVFETTPRGELAGRTVPRSLIDCHELVGKHREVAPDDFLEAMKEVDRALRKSHYEKHIEVPSDLRFGRLVERLGIEAPGLTEALVETHMAALYAQVEALDHHAEVLAALRDRAGIALCSNFSHSPTAERVLTSANLDGHLDAVVISDRHGLRKPRPEIFRAALEALDVSPEETLHVGDNLEADVAGAAGLGVRTAWITRRVKDPAGALEGYDGPRPDWQIADLRELLEIVAGDRPAA